MITNLPNSNDYHSQGKEWLLQAFDILFDKGSELKYFEEWDDEEWDFQKGKIATVIILAHQAIESKLKSEIIEVNPFFLIDSKPSLWPSLPGSVDKDFDSFYSINSESLIRIFCALCRVEDDKSEIVDLTEEVRLLRNKAVHSVQREILDPKYLTEIICRVCEFVYSDTIWNLIKSEHLRNEGYMWDEEEESIMILGQYLKFLEQNLTKSKFQKYLKVNGREYSCPNCHYEVEGYAYLSPNTPDSKNLNCLICGDDHAIEREDCKSEKCKGNLIGIDSSDSDYLLCLTCGTQQN